ncbi:MAG: hypothetical protein RIF41_14685 [Polyangiaceae bacterium]
MAKPKEETERLAMIYATGSDSELRHMCFALLEAGVIQKADLVDRAPFEVAADGVATLRWSGKAVTLVCRRAKLKSVLRRMKKEYLGDDLEAFGLPVLAAL